MFDYKSPIKQFVSEMQTTYENDVLKVVQNYGFDIDKNELAKALAYDRQQYETGYQHGKSDGAKEFKEWLIIKYGYAVVDIEEDFAECQKEVENG